MAKSDKRLSSLERATQQALGEGRIFGLHDDPAREAFPELWAWLSVTDAGRDAIKQPAVLSIRLGPEGVLVSLVDRDYAVSIDVGCQHLQQAFETLEAALRQPTCPMKTWGKKQPSLRKRRSL